METLVMTEKCKDERKRAAERRRGVRVGRDD